MASRTHLLPQTQRFCLACVPASTPSTVLRGHQCVSLCGLRASACPQKMLCTCVSWARRSWKVSSRELIPDGTEGERLLQQALGEGSESHRGVRRLKNLWLDVRERPRVLPDHAVLTSPFVDILPGDLENSTVAYSHRCIFLPAYFLLLSA